MSSSDVVESGMKRHEDRPNSSLAKGPPVKYPLDATKGVGDHDGAAFACSIYNFPPNGAMRCQREGIPWRIGGSVVVPFKEVTTHGIRQGSPKCAFAYTYRAAQKDRYRIIIHSSLISTDRPNVCFGSRADIGSSSGG
jgi:hypothetical protein